MPLVEKTDAAALAAIAAPLGLKCQLVDGAYELEIVAKGLTAARVTPARIDEVIVHTDFYVFPGTTLTVCCLTLANGFTVTGESACASPENFNAELGQRIARDNARQKIWALEGYALRERLAGTWPVGSKTESMNLPDIETVSAAVHQAWMQAKRKQGYATRQAEDGEELMAPYAGLSEKAKELDRGSVRAVYAAIEACAGHAASA